MSLPTTTDAWVIQDTDTTKGFGNLQLVKGLKIPPLGEKDVLVQIQAVSLNYRDMLILQGGYRIEVQVPRVPCSDGAGRVLAVGSKVTRFSHGDPVVTMFFQDYQAALTEAARSTALGAALDGTLRRYAVLSETGLALAPSNLSPIEASTLTCAPLTAWNALFGLPGNELRVGQTVLTQGTGGVSLAAVLFAKAAGAFVIATTSSDDKAERLKGLGADVIINYKTNPDWGETARRLSPGGAGVDLIIEVGGPGSMTQSLKAIKLEGIIAVVGFLGGTKASGEPSILSLLSTSAVIRGVLVGSLLQMEEMNRAIVANNLQMVVDPKQFGFEEALQAYEYHWMQQNFGKVVMQLDCP